jgi:hypothetical protein
MLPKRAIKRLCSNLRARVDVTMDIDHGQSGLIAVNKESASFFAFWRTLRRVLASLNNQPGAINTPITVPNYGTINRIWPYLSPSQDL